MRSSRRTITSLLASTLTALSLCGCVGAWVDMPDKRVSRTAAHTQLIDSGKTPVITRTEKTASERHWCGTTLWAVIIPIPLKLPVCESYSSATAYGNDINGVETPLLHSSQKMASDFYACGPFLFLGPIMHSYRGNAICGSFQ
ncbi:hypothetical protein PLD_00960 [Pseudomonas sp. LD120]|nr:hypothetical protein PLD_00960 [Pseudomonas sp. LD120]